MSGACPAVALDETAKPRERILAAAQDLFYRQGIRAAHSRPRG